MESESYRLKRYAYDYEQYESEGKNAATMIENILSDPEFTGLDGIVIGSWGGRGILDYAGELQQTVGCYAAA